MGNKIFQTSNIDMLLLKILLEKDLYGYEIITILKEKSNLLFELKAGTIYPILHALEQEGLVTSYEKDTNAGKIRKYYKITEKGRTVLEDKMQNWRAYSEAVNHVLDW